jgi:hypothetical protein
MGFFGRKPLSSPRISSSPEILTGVLNFGKLLLESFAEGGGFDSLRFDQRG